MGEARRRRLAGKASTERLPNKAEELLRRAPEDMRKITLGEAAEACPYKSLLGFDCDETKETWDRIRATIVILDRERSPMSPEMLADAVEVIRTGGVILLMAARREDREFAKAQIQGMLGPAGGLA